MENLLNYVFYNNKKLLKNETSIKLNEINVNYVKNNKNVIEILFINPYRCVLNSNTVTPKGILIYIKTENIEESVFQIVQNIPINGYVYFIKFYGYNIKVEKKNLPDYKTLISKNVLIIY